MLCPANLKWDLVFYLSKAIKSMRLFFACVVGPQVTVITSSLSTDLVLMQSFSELSQYLAKNVEM
jgi:hypothetical protein